MCDGYTTMRNHIRTSPLLVALLGALAACQGAWGTEAPCTEAATTARMVECAGDRFQGADRELNRLYRELSASLDERRRDQLRVAQRAWIGFRDAQARFAGSLAEEGSLSGVLELEEKAALTKQRIEHLRRGPP